MVALSTGPFAHFNLVDGAQCVLLADALDHYITGNGNTHNQYTRSASPLQLATADTLAQQMRASPLLTQIIAPFLGAPRYRYNHPQELLDRARNMELFVNEDCYNPSSPEYAGAQSEWRDYVRLHPTATTIGNTSLGLQRLLDNQRGGSGPRLLSESETRTVQEGTYANRGEDKGQSQKRAEQIENDSALARALHVVQYDSQNPTGDLSESDLEEQRPRGTRHRPLKPRDHRLIREGLDLETAKFGVVDRSKLEIHIRAEKPSPSDPGEYMPAPTIHRYFKKHDKAFLVAFDFNNRDHIDKLNAWRNQIRYRGFPPTRKERSFWLDRENEMLIFMIRKRLDEEKKPLKWRRLTNDYNARMKGKIQKKGEKVLCPGKKKYPQLEEDRFAPWRVSSAIKLQMEKDLDTKKRIQDAEHNYFSVLYSGSESEPNTSVSNAAPQNSQARHLAVASPRPRRIRQLSPDDDEIDDPFPEPSKETRKAKRYGAPVYKPRESKSAPKSDFKVDVSEPEEENTPKKSLGKEVGTAALKRKRSETQSERVEESLR